MSSSLKHPLSPRPDRNLWSDFRKSHTNLGFREVSCVLPVFPSPEIRAWGVGGQVGSRSGLVADFRRDLREGVTRRRGSEGWDPWAGYPAVQAGGRDPGELGRWVEGSGWAGRRWAALGGECRDPGELGRPCGEVSLGGGWRELVEQVRAGRPWAAGAGAPAGLGGGCPRGSGHYGEGGTGFYQRRVKCMSKLHTRFDR